MLAAEPVRFTVAFGGGPPLEVRLHDLDRLPEPPEAERLSSERERSGRFHRPEDGRRFVVRRHLLRGLLAERTGRDPLELEPVPDAFGRPIVAGLEPLRFNTSRSGSRFAIALFEDDGRGAEPGIDLETLREIPDAAAVGRRILSDAEARALGSGHRLDPPHLLRIWTRKEAVLKSVGRGLTIDPASVTVPLDPSPVSEPTEVTVPLESGVRRVRLVDPAPGNLPDGVFLSTALAHGAGAGILDAS